MKRCATESDKQSGKSDGQSFLAVFDSRKRKIPGLWQRGSRYYAQLRVDLGNGRTARGASLWKHRTSMRPRQSLIARARNAGTESARRLATVPIPMNSPANT